MTRRKFSCEFKIEAVTLVTERGVSVARACRDLDLAESVLRRWLRELTAAPAAAFSGHGQMGPGLAEISALKKAVARLRAERDILKKAAAFFAREATRGSASSRSTATSGRSAGQPALQGAGGLALRFLRMVQPPGQRPHDPGREARHGDRQELQGQRPHLWRPSCLARCARGRTGLRPSSDRATDAAECE